MVITYFCPADINECVEAAMSSQQLCNQTQVCINTPGSFMCHCPPGTELNTQVMCQIPTPSPSTTNATPSFATIATTSTMATSTSRIAVMSTSHPVTPSVPAEADQNQVIVTLDGLTSSLVGCCKMYNIGKVINAICDISSLQNRGKNFVK